MIIPLCCSFTDKTARQICKTLLKLEKISPVPADFSCCLEIELEWVGWEKVPELEYQGQNTKGLLGKACIPQEFLTVILLPLQQYFQ